MKVQALREMTREELGKKDEELCKQLLNLRFQLGTKQIENPNKIREVRRDIARVRTVMRAQHGETD
ncbi:MAG: 50S ribosomal protein L29 [Acidobacteria bacterium]|nr:MAG: 50S ribosomal protein L29 [Acidobacteriota bacterium]